MFTRNDYTHNIDRQTDRRTQTNTHASEYLISHAPALQRLWAWPILVRHCFRILYSIVNKLYDFLYIHGSSGD